MAPPFPRKAWERQDWLRIRSLTKIEIIKLLDKDARWQAVGAKGSKYTYYNAKLKSPHNYLTIHYHSDKDQFNNENLLKDILDHWCCSKDDFVRWKVIKG